MECDVENGWVMAGSHMLEEASNPAKNYWRYELDYSWQEYHDAGATILANSTGNPWVMDPEKLK